MGYPMVQQWRVRSNLYRVKLSTITLSAGEDATQIAKELGMNQRPKMWQACADPEGPEGKKELPRQAGGLAGSNINMLQEGQ